MGLLESRYGDTLKILASYLGEIKKWPSIRAGETTAFKQFINLNNFTIFFSYVRVPSTFLHFCNISEISDISKESGC